MLPPLDVQGELESLETCAVDPGDCVLCYSPFIRNVTRRRDEAIKRLVDVWHIGSRLKLAFIQSKVLLNNFLLQQDCCDLII